MQEKSKPNEFELAILECLAQDVSAIGLLISKLRVVSRDFTGAGSCTEFDCAESSAELGDQFIGLNSLIIMPSVENGMGAILMCKKGKPECLETYTFGGECWNGTFYGFSIGNDT